MNISKVSAYSYSQFNRTQTNQNTQQIQFKGIKPYNPSKISGEGFISKIKNLFKKITHTETPAKPSKPQAASKIPLKDANVFKVSKLSRQETNRNINHAGKKITNIKTGLTYKYNENGYVEKVINANGNTIREIFRKADGSVKNYWDFVFDANGNNIRTIRRKADGSVNDYLDFVFDTKGKVVGTIIRNANYLQQK